MSEGINVLSLFDGMSCGQIALQRAGIKVNQYYASEIKKIAIKVTQDNFPKTIQLGSVTEVCDLFLPEIDLLIGGSPCQDLSFAKTSGKGLEGDKSRMFYEWVRLKEELNPKYFLLENVKMKKHSEDLISEILGVDPVQINSNLVSFQNRSRLYWTNIPSITIPEDRGISFQDFKLPENEYTREFKVKKTPSRINMYEKLCPNVTYRTKINCLTCKQDRQSNSGLIDFEDFCRYLTTEELERAQTVPVGYTSCLTKTQAEDVLGDGWTVDVIAHIFKNLPYAKVENNVRQLETAV